MDVEQWSMNEQISFPVTKLSKNVTDINNEIIVNSLYSRKNFWSPYKISYETHKTLLEGRFSSFIFKFKLAKIVFKLVENPNKEPRRLTSFIRKFR